MICRQPEPTALSLDPWPTAALMLQRTHPWRCDDFLLMATPSLLEALTVSGVEPTMHTYILESVLPNQ